MTDATRIETPKIWLSEFKQAVARGNTTILRGLFVRVPVRYVKKGIADIIENLVAEGRAAAVGHILEAGKGRQRLLSEVSEKILSGFRRQLDGNKPGFEHTLTLLRGLKANPAYPNWPDLHKEAVDTMAARGMFAIVDHSPPGVDPQWSYVNYFTTTGNGKLHFSSTLRATQDADPYCPDKLYVPSHDVDGNSFWWEGGNSLNPPKGSAHTEKSMLGAFHRWGADRETRLSGHIGGTTPDRQLKAHFTDRRYFSDTMNLLAMAAEHPDTPEKTKALALDAISCVIPGPFRSSLDNATAQRLENVLQDAPPRRPPLIRTVRAPHRVILKSAEVSEPQ